MLAFSILLINCKNENKSYCLPLSLKQKLDDFKFEIADSLEVKLKQLALVDKLIEKASDEQHILVNLIQFSNEEITSIKRCICTQSTPFSDTNMIDASVNGLIPANFMTLSKLSTSNEDNHYLKLYWLYQLIEKTYISNDINVLDKTTFVLNGDTLTDFSEIGKRIRLRNSKSNAKQKSRSTISIKADKDDVDMVTIDKVENELREINALRINYSTNPE